ncbi:hypothetical protein BVRB_005590 [Beta vulgaris subsp. vulgaris]|uniref:Cytochrome P450 n=2 Tax=Beta vulgaris subsp. vulgaris TaxID=3555 RepID=A0A0J8B3J4_BETVV|nr:hypothetical protein BVRB_005590 [Beta vulgaris subsp. vulgaris]
MLPSLLINVHRIHDFFIEVMDKSNLTFHLKGPWLANMHILATVDPANLHHILSKSFRKYIKGAKLNEIAEVFGNGIIVADSPLWEYHRNVAQSFLYHPDFHHFLVNITCKKMENGLLPVLNHFSEHAIEFDLQDLFLRFMYDTMCAIMMDHDPQSLSLNLPHFPLLTAVADITQVIYYRHLLPTRIWKLLRWLNIGYEKKNKLAWNTLDNFVYNCIDRKREERRNRTSKQKDQDMIEVSVDLLTLFMDTDEIAKTPTHQNNDKFLRETISNFFLAGGETTSTALSWFFCLLSKSPQVVKKIKEELDLVMLHMDNYKDMFLRNFKELSGNLVYLHAAICETLRLYPSVVFNHKLPIETDILPSGHVVNPNTEIIFNMYAMGRMKSIWGDDSDKFKPERWIDKRGKIVAAMIIRNYDIQAVEDHHHPDASIILRIKQGLKVKVCRY